jgi:hypothetical protein
VIDILNVCETISGLIERSKSRDETFMIGETGSRARYSVRDSVLSMEFKVKCEYCVRR